MSATAESLDALHNDGAMQQTESTVPKGFVPYKPGQSGNIAGRPTGSRQRLSERFIHDCYLSWQVYGRDVLERLALTDAATYAKVMVQLVPKQSAHIRANLTQSRPLDAINADLIQAVQALGFDVVPRTTLEGVGGVVSTGGREPVGSPVPAGLGGVLLGSKDLPDNSNTTNSIPSACTNSVQTTQCVDMTTQGSTAEDQKEPQKK